MPDRVKETVFNILGSYYACPGQLPALRVADVFAGSGSMGLEALSRGAVCCCFFEQDRSALAALRWNFSALRVGAEATIVTADAWRHGVAGCDGCPFELVLVDPPYRDSMDTSPAGPVRRYLTRLGEHDESRPLVVVHHSAKVRFTMDPNDSWRVADERTIGSNAVTFFAQ